MIRKMDVFFCTYPGERDIWIVFMELRQQAQFYDLLQIVFRIEEHIALVVVQRVQESTLDTHILKVATARNCHQEAI